MKKAVAIASIALVVLTTNGEIVVQEWERRYITPGNNVDQAAAIAMDTNGNVFVTGPSSGGPTDSDYATVKYSVEGLPLWTNRYNGPGNSEDIATSIAVGRNGNVFVTGYSSAGSEPFNNFDLATIAYSNTGVPLWTNRFRGTATSDGANDDYGAALAVDATEDVYVTGYMSDAGGGYSIGTVKYSAAGLPLWTNKYGPVTINFMLLANAIALDTNGNVFVTGYSADGAGHNDYATIKYTSTGTALWTNHYSGLVNGHDHATAIAADGNGGVIVTGYSAGDSTSLDYATVKYSSQGVPLWTNRYNGPGNGNDFARAMAAASNGDVFVTGYSSGNGSGNDYATVAYSAAGVPLWTNRYNGTGNGDDRANAVAVDGEGNVLVTGYSSNGTNNDLLTIRYSSTGQSLWTNRYGALNGNATAIAVGTANDFVITGYSIGSGSGWDFVTVKYSIANPVPLSIQSLSDYAILDWTNSSFVLQTAPAITGTFTNIPGATSPYTNPITGGQQFFRLIAN